MRQRRRLCRIDGDALDFAGCYAVEKVLQAVKVHRLMQAIADCFLHQRMIGNTDLAGQVVAAGGLIGKDGGEQIIRTHPLDRRRNLAPP